MKKISVRLSNILYPLAALGILVAIWAVAAAAVNKELIIPSLSSTFNRLFSLLGDGAFYQAVGNTLLRTVASFLIGAAVALVCSLLSLYPPVRKTLAPIIKIVRSIPTMSIILLTVIWLRPSTSPILIAFLINFPIMYSGFFSAFSGVDKELIEMSKSYNVSKKDTVLSLYMPSVAPAAFDCMQASVSLTVKIIISAEVLAQTKNSMGLMMQMARGYLETAELLAWTLTAIILSYMLELAVYGIKKVVVRWK